jgi:5-amino-6-(5-phosphoribosylamino)uracil reductase
MSDTGLHPYVLLSCCLSLDGYLDDAAGERLVLSNPADLDRVDDLRAGCDAILVGAGTVRADNPRLVVHSGRRRARRRARGESPTPLKVTLTATGDLDPQARLFGEPGETLVLCASPAFGRTRDSLRDRATVRDAGEAPSMADVLTILHEHGVRRLVVEGGRTLLTQLLTAGLADELQLALAPLFVGDSRAPRFVADGRFPWHAGHRAELVDVRQLDDVVLLRYQLRDRHPAQEALGVR